MTYRVKFGSAAQKAFDALPDHIQQRVLRWTELLAEDPRRPGTKQLQGKPGLRRVHASKDYVILYTIRDDEVLVLIVDVGHRSRIYRNL